MDNPSTSSQATMRRCPCNEYAVLHTVFKEGSNKGRKFWRCGKGDGSSCKFWEWDDEPPRNQTRGSGLAEVTSSGVSSRGGYSQSQGDSGAADDACFKVRGPSAVDVCSLTIFFPVSTKGSLGQWYALLFPRFVSFKLLVLF